MIVRYVIFSVLWKLYWQKWHFEQNKCMTDGPELLYSLSITHLITKVSQKIEQKYENKRKMIEN